MSVARWKPIAILIAVFLLGGIAGAGAGRALAMKELAGAMRGPPTEARARFRLEAMRRQGKCLIRMRIERWGPIATGGFPRS